MAFINASGHSVSFDCSELIKELKSDIAEFGGHIILNVVAQDVMGVTLYKD